MTFSNQAMIGVLAGTFALTAAPPTRAISENDMRDMFTFNGSACSFSDPNATVGQDRSSGKLKNVSSSTQWAICPIMRTRTTAAIVAAALMTTPHVDATQCKLKVRHWNDGTYESLSYTDVQNIGGNSEIRFLFNPPRNVGDDTSLAIACPIPSAEAILTYMFDSDLWMNIDL